LVISCSVRERTGEISVRMALGAAPADVARMVVGQGLKLTLFGLGAGLLSALALGRYLSSQLFGIRPSDPATFIAVAVLLAAVALLTSYLPARRATRVDPATVLRSEYRASGGVTAGKASGYFPPGTNRRGNGDIR
jgi:ABC-type antimicrobial peptide transport system permease subunit